MGIACMLVAVVLLLFASCSASTSEREIQDIKIGALYNKKTESLLRVLEYVISYRLPRELYLPSHKLTLTRVMVNGKDLLSKEVLSSLAQVVSIIDLACEDKKALDLSTLLEVPMVKVDSTEDTTSHPFAVSIRPSYHVVNQALFDVMDAFNFSRVAVVYDAARVREASHFYAKARRWPRFDIQVIPELILNDRKQLRKSLTLLLKSHVKEIILFCDQRDLAGIMNEALFVGINDKYYRWITPDLEVAGPNQTYPSILGMVGLRLHLSDEQAGRMLKLQATKESGVEYSLSTYAAVHDAAIVVGMAVENLVNKHEGMRVLAKHISNSTCPLHSASTQRSGLGWKLLGQIRKVQFEGLTGEMQFKMSTGERRVHSGLDILNVVEHNVNKIGYWQAESGIRHVSIDDSEEIRWVGDFAELVRCHNPGNMEPRETEPIPVLKVTTVLEPPFVEQVNASVPLPTSGKIPRKLLQGFCIDLIEELSKLANFKYEIYLQQSGYAGMVQELKDKKRDIALAPMTITAKRELDIDFSKPFMDFRMSLIMREPGEPPINIFAFLLPFTGGVWLSTVGVVLGMTLVMYVMDYLSPFGYHARARESEEEPGNEFNMLNSLWFATASVLQQGPDNTPLAPSGRLLASAFWFFILILISTYTANLAAFFTIKRTVETINSLAELQNQTKIKYGVYANGSVQTFFKSSEDPLYVRMYAHMVEHKTFVPSTSKGVDKARTEDYAYITEQPYLEYYNQQKPCNTRLLNNLLQAKGYGIGLQKDSRYTNQISVAILELRERNFIEKTRLKWWDERSQCPKPLQSKTGSTQRLGVNNMAGVFLVLLGGVVVSIILVVVEMRCKKLVIYFTSGQTSMKRHLSCESPGESRDPIDDPVRVAVVQLSQGDRVLKPEVQRKPKKSAWNNWQGKD